jgi:hypothetical protein
MKESTTQAGATCTRLPFDPFSKGKRPSCAEKKYETETNIVGWKM